VFSGLIERGDGLEAPASVRLYDELLENALSALPPTTRRLIIVPDGALHRLPFDALRPSRDAPPLGAAFELVTAPSATLWLRWQKDNAGVTGRRALVLADPDLGASGESLERNATLGAGLRLGRLPYARRESRSVERHVGAADSLVGDAASEGLLKQQDLGAYSVLHFAAHAIADDVRPERSAVLLAAGADAEDGLLQAREIEELDLEGRIVVLSACQTASGAVLSGEGVLSLARAFFEAGAHAVIGSRWPIRDADAASFFDGFYRHLGQGASLASALHQARLDAIAAGQPAAAWAGLVLLGNGALVPFPAGRPEARRTVESVGWRWVAVFGVVAAVAALLVRRRRSRS
jgi:CHAT domain-containing protein